MINLPTAANAASDSPAANSVGAAAPDAATKAVAQAERKTAPQPEPSMSEVKQAAKQLETFMQSMNRYLEFRIDQDSGRTVVTVKDTTTGDVIRQIPSEEVLRLAQNLGGKAHTALVSQTA